MRGKDYLKWPKGGAEVLNVAKGLVVMAKVNGLDMISSYVEKLEGTNQVAPYTLHPTPQALNPIS